jgi:hypothetical protein
MRGSGSAEGVEDRPPQPEGPEGPKIRVAPRRHRCASWSCCNAALLFYLIVGIALSSARGQDVEKVPPFEVVALALTVLAAEKSCKDVGLDPDVLGRFLADNGITAAQLSSKGPKGERVVKFRHQLHRQFQRHNADVCEKLLAIFGPESAVLAGALKRR